MPGRRDDEDAALVQCGRIVMSELDREVSALADQVPVVVDAGYTGFMSGDAAERHCYKRCIG